jgi:hypothetical protein
MPTLNTQQRRDAFFGKTNSGEKFINALRGDTQRGVLFFTDTNRGGELKR